MSDTKMHEGSCHCGAVRYEVELDLSQPALTCNCSMCGRSGAMLAFTTPDKFRLLEGEDHLTDYQFNKTSCITSSARRAASSPSDAARAPRAT